MSASESGLPDLDEDAFARAFLCGVDGSFVGAFGNRRQARGSSGVVNGVAVFDIGETIVEQSEYVWCNLDTNAIAGA